MFKKLSALALSATLIGSFAFSSNSEQVDPQPKKAADFNLSLVDKIGASPDLAEKAKELGVNLSKTDPAEKLNNGTKFQQAGDNHVAYQESEGEVPMLVILAKFKEGDEPVGDPEGQVDAKYFKDLIFGDSYNPYELPQFEQYAEFNGKEAPTDKTMQNAYKESSYGNVELVRLEDTDYAWVELPKGASYYLDQEGTYADGGEYLLGNANGDAHMGEFVRDALKSADSDVDFSKYAEDGEVPNVFIIHEGTGAEFSRDPAQIWSHKWSVLSALYYGKYYETGVPAPQYEGMEYNEWIDKTIEEDMTYDGVVVNNYNIQPEIGGNVAGYNLETGGYDEASKTGPFPAQPGVYAHEFGHALGLPDFYDTAYSSEGVGNYSMMAGGSWMRYPDAAAYSGNSPTHFDPFSKIFLNWIEPIEVTPEDATQTITLPSIDEADADNGVVKMEVPGSNGTEYFLFENIQQSGFNEGLIRQGKDSNGLVAWHVDENIINLYQTAGFRPNNVENWKNKRFQYNQSSTASDGTIVTHYGLSVLQADGNYDLEKYENRGDAGDFLKTGDKLTPNSKNVHTGSYYFWKDNSNVPADSGIHVTNIQENEDGSITADFYYESNEAK
ncbi:M6 family metalloprotease domain-containing protein [Virgibacillus subterraneus]|uniref:M6 family metalloprotease domain-containing protein n=2 Tax=Virgibacillus TaxID=84406 RepID=A0A1H1F340_9BACI|nr:MULTISPECIES: M6 family metalloprotease domain-containing protein [Virgibacillus]SDQ95209.1 M6 family metalloprotease domain-containing protein [Virgibacillus salinus]SEQ96379.1 M6 family metalloprotease domain-containing protein [Virgibacillus subterraneus]